MYICVWITHEKFQTYTTSSHRRDEKNIHVHGYKVGWHDYYIPYSDVKKRICMENASDHIITNLIFPRGEVLYDDVLEVRMVHNYTIVAPICCCGPCVIIFF